MKLSPTTKKTEAPPPNPEATARLVAALDVVLAASDKVSAAVEHFSRLDPDTDPPAAWVERAVELHVALLEAWWALDDQAALDAAAGGWTVGPPHAVGTAMERRYTRLGWEVELMRPAGEALWWDKAVAPVNAARTEAALEEAGRALVREASKRRYQSWRNEVTT